MTAVACIPNFLKLSGDCNGERILKIGQYLTRLCVEHLGFTFLAHPVTMHILSVVNHLLTVLKFSYSQTQGTLYSTGYFDLLGH